MSIEQIFKFNHPGEKDTIRFFQFAFQECKFFIRCENDIN